MSASEQVTVPAAELIAFAGEVLERTGIAAADARFTAQALVDADLAGVSSHGVMLLPLYAERLRAGSVASRSSADIVTDAGAVIVLDAGNMLGQLSSRQAVELADQRARSHGLATVAVRNGFHFGTAGFWARMLAERGHVGIALCNTRPLMPAPGGAERVIGNNPIAIAAPVAGEAPLVFDMAASATAMGKIRLAAAAGRPIPEGWAADAAGNVTTDTAEAIKGMLLPAAGPKGFGLATMIDVLAGGLSGGAIADEVRPLYGDPRVPYGCAHLFIAMSPAQFGVDERLPERVAELVGRIRGSRRASGVDAVHAPGDIERERARASDGRCTIEAATLASLADTAARLGVPRHDRFSRAG